MRTYEYKILINAYADHLEEQVVKYLAEDWQLAGGVCHSDVDGREFFSQAIQRTTTNL